MAERICVSAQSTYGATAQLLGHVFNHFLCDAIAFFLSFCSELILDMGLNCHLEVRVIHQVCLLFTLSDFRKLFKNKIASLSGIKGIPQAVCVILR